MHPVPDIDAGTVIHFHSDSGKFLDVPLKMASGHERRFNGNRRSNETRSKIARDPADKTLSITMINKY